MPVPSCGQRKTGSDLGFGQMSLGQQLCSYSRSAHLAWPLWSQKSHLATVISPNKRKQTHGKPGCEHASMFRDLNIQQVEAFQQTVFVHCYSSSQATFAEKIISYSFYYQETGLLSREKQAVEVTFNNGRLHIISFIMEMLTFAFCHPDT